MKRMWLMIGMLVAVVGSARSAEYYVPDDFATIQEAIDACVDGDTVIVLAMRDPDTGALVPRILEERQIEFRGKAITVCSEDPDDRDVVANTIVSAGGFGNVFVFNNSEDPRSVLKGLTITNGFYFQGGGIWCAGGSPTIQQCVIAGNSSMGSGAGVYCADEFSSPILDRCVLMDNLASNGFGGAVFACGGSPVLRNCLIVGNVAQYGGALAFKEIVPAEAASEPVIEGCTIVDNVATQGASAVHCDGQTSLWVENTIFWGNVCEASVDSVIYATGTVEGTSAWIDYSVVQDAPESVVAAGERAIILGAAVLTDDPLFVQPGVFDGAGGFVPGDYHLQEGSPCIDAGNPDFAAYPGEADLDGEARVQGPAIDIGADETPALELIEADVRIVPNQIYRNLPCRWILCMVRIDHPEYGVRDIDRDSVVLNDTINPVHVYTLRHALIARFENKHVLKALAAGDGEVTLTVSGRFKDGMAWAGEDQVEIKTFHWRWRHWMKNLRHGRWF